MIESIALTGWSSDSIRSAKNSMASAVLSALAAGLIVEALYLYQAAPFAGPNHTLYSTLAVPVASSRANAASMRANPCSATVVCG